MGVNLNQWVVLAQYKGASLLTCLILLIMSGVGAFKAMVESKAKQSK